MISLTTKELQIKNKNKNKILQSKRMQVSRQKSQIYQAIGDYRNVGSLEK